MAERLVGRVRRAAWRPRVREGGLQCHQRELAPQLGARRREELVPKPIVLGERAFEHPRRASVLLQLRERRCLQPLDVCGLETEEQPRLIAAVAARMPRRHCLISDTASPATSLPPARNT